VSLSARVIDWIVDATLGLQQFWLLLPDKTNQLIADISEDLR
jgi:hypothetical protein